MIINRIKEMNKQDFLELKQGYIDHLTEYFVHYIDGRGFQKKQDYLTHFSHVFRFPSYYGNNISAFIDCMRDLDRREEQGFIIIIYNYKKSFFGNEEDKLHFLSSLEYIAYFHEKECLTTSGGRNHLKSFDVYLIDDDLTDSNIKDIKMI